MNDYQDATSVDIYFATDTDYAMWSDGLVAVHVMPAPAGVVARCRDAQSYGKAIDGLRVRDAADGKLQPLAAFVENGAIRESAPMITGGEDEGGSHVDADPRRRLRDLVQQLVGLACPSNNMIRDAQNGKACAAAQRGRHG